jgi:hypothetical protein
MRQIACGLLAAGLMATTGTAQAQTTGSASFLTQARSVARTAADNSAAQAPATQDGFVSFFRGTELFGTVDGYFTYSSNTPETGSLIPIRAFDAQHNQFTLALAEIGLAKPATADDPVGFRVDFDFGPVADAVNAFEPGGDTFRNVQQAYLSYLAPVGNGLTVEFGRYVTQHGAEVIEAKDNWNYSRSLLFTWAIPFYHTGLRLNYSMNDRLSFGGTISNGWNNSTENNSGKTYSLMATIKPVPALTILQNYMGGPEQTGNADDWRHLYDATATYTVNDTLSVMANYDYGHDTVEGQGVSWQGVALYAKAQLNPYFAIIPRYEYYNDDDGFTTGTAQALQEFTLTAEVKHSRGLIARFEYRGDSSDEDFFVKEGTPRGSQHTFTVGLIYAFSSK